jgi:LysM repeat protein
MLRFSAPMRWTFALAFAAAVLGSATAWSKPKAVRHVIQRGETLSSIAARFDTNVSSICRWNGIKRTARLTPGRTIGVPLPPGAKAPSDTAPPAASAKSGATESGATEASVAKPREVATTWRDYSRIPREPGNLTLQGYGRSFTGRVIADDGSVLPEAYAAIHALMAPGRSDEDAVIDRDLVKLIVRVSDVFGGRPIQLVSGYRPGHRSRHAHGAAIDFYVKGVPNWALRDYGLTLDKVGVGYYPNSNHVHLDVRDRKTTWVDVSKPGKRARYVKTKKRRAKR